MEATESFVRVQDALCFRRHQNPRNDRVVYTPLHGVGLPFVRDAFAAFGLPSPIAVLEQAEPDGSFPTTPFPNPEEGQGVWHLAMKCGALACSSPLGLAHAGGGGGGGHRHAAPSTKMCIAR